MKKIFILLLLSFLSVKSIYAESDQSIKPIFEGNENAKIKILVYESLSCSHCANFHKEVYPNLKKDFIDTGLIRIEFKHFPLDMASLNASKIAQCKNDGKSDLLHLLFDKQSSWLKGDTLNEINENIKLILKEKNINLDYNKCTSSEEIENYILNDRIEGVKKFEVNSTPTIIINNEKFEESLKYKNLKKFIEKLI
tara:strand:+ start:1909 stop:2496 length:588 start_codon:yes stop_codon:yes gene_type:complete